MQEARLDLVVTAVRGAERATLWPLGAEGFEAGPFLDRLKVLCADPACGLGEEGCRELRELAGSLLSGCAWVMATEDWMGSSYVNWYGHCFEWFVQSVDGSCLRVQHIAGE